MSEKILRASPTPFRGSGRATPSRQSVERCQIRLPKTVSGAFEDLCTPHRQSNQASTGTCPGERCEHSGTCEVAGTMSDACHWDHLGGIGHATEFDSDQTLRHRRRHRVGSGVRPDHEDGVITRRRDATNLIAAGGTHDPDQFLAINPGKRTGLRLEHLVFSDPTDDGARGRPASTHSESPRPSRRAVAAARSRFADAPYRPSICDDCQPATAMSSCSGPPAAIQR